jgi:hypothetical protein
VIARPHETGRRRSPNRGGEDGNRVLDPARGFRKRRSIAYPTIPVGILIETCGAVGIRLGSRLSGRLSAQFRIHVHRCLEDAALSPTSDVESLPTSSGSTFAGDSDFLPPDGLSAGGELHQGRAASDRRRRCRQRIAIGPAGALSQGYATLCQTHRRRIDTGIQSPHRGCSGRTAVSVRKFLNKPNRKKCSALGPATARGARGI